MANGPTDHDAGEIQLLIAADPGRAETQALVVPVVVSETGFEALPSDTSDFTPVGLRPYSGWLALALKPHLRPDAAGYLVLMRAVVPGKREFNFPYPLKMLSEPHLRRLVESDVLTLSTPLASEFGQRRENVGEGLGTPVGEKFRNNKPAADLPRQTYAAAFVSSEAISNLLPRTTKQDSVTFALASCQYPAGILDSQCASASIERMDKMVTSSPTDGGIEAVLMVGDQIYADATAGLFDPTTANDRYGRSYEEWLGAPALRRLMRRVPVHVMLDDHEIEDNWEPYRSKQSGRNREAGIQAYWQWQRGVVQPDPDAPLWYEAAAGEFNVFMADTRSERRSRRPDLTLAGSAQIMGQAQMQALQQWLRDQKAQHDISGKPIRPKFIASPAWLLPRRVGAMGEAESPACCDGWEGYPTSMHQLLGFIAMNDIRGVVVLSGDSHLGYVALARIHAAKAVPPIRLVCINAPPMYAPYPFANKVAEDYLLRDRFSVGTHPDIQLQSRAWQMGKGDGFVQVKAALEAGRWKITANFVAASGGEAPLTFDVK